MRARILELAAAGMTANGHRSGVGCYQSTVSRAIADYAIREGGAEVFPLEAKALDFARDRLGRRRTGRRRR
jgi:hypothetical protein